MVGNRNGKSGWESGWESGEGNTSSQLSLEFSHPAQNEPFFIAPNENISEEFGKISEVLKEKEAALKHMEEEKDPYDEFFDIEKDLVTLWDICSQAQNDYTAISDKVPNGIVAWNKVFSEKKYSFNGDPITSMEELNFLVGERTQEYISTLRQLNPSKNLYFPTAEEIRKRVRKGIEKRKKIILLGESEGTSEQQFNKACLELNFLGDLKETAKEKFLEIRNQYISDAVAWKVVFEQNDFFFEGEKITGIEALLNLMEQEETEKYNRLQELLDEKNPNALARERNNLSKPKEKESLLAKPLKAELEKLENVLAEIAALPGGSTEINFQKLLRENEGIRMFLEEEKRIYSLAEMQNKIEFIKNLSFIKE